MNFKQLEAYVSVVRCRSFSRAAEEIFLSQPTVSAHIHALESECGTRLIIRTTREVIPSRAGKIFYEYASELLSLRDKAICAVKNDSENISGTLEIAASTVPAQYILPDVLAAMSEKYPQLFFSLRQYDSRGVVNHIENMDAEIGIAGTIPDDSSCDFEPFVRDHLVVITPNTPEYRRYEGRPPSELLFSEPFLAREEGSGTKREMEYSMIRAGMEPGDLKTAATLDSNESIKHAVSRGLGISVISRIAAEDYARFGLLRIFELDKKFFERQFYFVFRRNRPLSPGAELLMQTARSIAESRRKGVYSDFRGKPLITAPSHI